MSLRARLLCGLVLAVGLVSGAAGLRSIPAAPPPPEPEVQAAPTDQPLLADDVVSRLNDAYGRREEKPKPRETSPEVERGAEMLADGDAAGAGRLARKRLEADANDPGAHYLLGVVLAQDGDRPEALAELSHSLVACPSSGSAWYWAGRCLEELGCWEDAVKAYEAAVAGQPPDRRAPKVLPPLKARLDGSRPPRGELAKHEPERGCYVGAFVPTFDDNLGHIADFVERTGKRHASFITYVGYGMPFPREWADAVAALGAAPHIAFEPNRGLAEVRDAEYLRQWAREAGEFGHPIFLRFASEMNGKWDAWHGDPATYRAKFRLVHDVMEELAPNVAMVWTVFEEPLWNIDSYYPGDDVVDWVGVNIYSVYCHNGSASWPARGEDPVDFLRPIYEDFAGRKPIQVSEYAATHRCYATGKDCGAWAVGKLERMYSALPVEFPRVKGINWFSCDAGEEGLAHNDYSVLTDPDVLAAYRKTIADSYWLSAVGESWSPRPAFLTDAPAETESTPGPES